MIIYDQFSNIQNFQRALSPQTSNWLGITLGRFLQQIGSSSTPKMKKKIIVYWSTALDFTAT